MPSPLHEPGDRSSSTGFGPSTSKRRRISVACKLCRSRKSRCSGDRPCSMCVQLGAVCEFEPTTQYDNLILPQTAFSDLQDRLKAIEKLIQLSHQNPSYLPPNDTLTPISNPPGSSHRVRSNTENWTAIPLQSQPSQPPRPAGQDEPQSISRIAYEPEEGNTIDGMAITVSEGNQSAFFGPSSNTAFLRQIQSLARNMTVPSLKECIMHGTITVTRPLRNESKTDSDLMRQTNEFVLPPQRLLEALINIFFSHAALLFPYLHEPTFRGTYAELKASRFTSARRTWLALLNMVLAIASKLSQPSGETSRQLDADQTVYYQRAVKLCNEFMFCATSVETVQCLLLMAWHLQSTQDSTRTWFIHGLAVRAATSLGFHLELATDDFNEVEREIRVRLWYGCIALDRILGLSLGRPWAIQKNSNILRRPVPILSSSTPNLGSSDAAQVEALGVHFLNETTTLHDITVDVIAAFYSDNMGFTHPEAPEKIFPEVIALVGRLEAWWENVHASVRWRPGLSNPYDRLPSVGMIELLKEMLKLDFLNAQLLLYRPVVFLASKMKMSLESEEHSVLHKMTLTCVRKSFNAALLLITMVQNLQRSTGPLAGSPWLSLYQTFHAALSAFSIMLVAPHTLPRPVDQSFFVLERAVSVLKNMGPGNNKMGQACAQYVQLLLSILRDSGSDRMDEQFLKSRPRSPIDPRLMSPHATEVTNPQLQPDCMAFGAAPDIDLAQFFTQDQIDFFGLDGQDDGLILQEDRVMPYNK